MTVVRVAYEGGIRMDLDQALRTTARQVHAEDCGSGQLMTPPYRRDLSWGFPTVKKARAFARFVRGMLKQLHIVVQVTVE